MEKSAEEREVEACTPIPVDKSRFNGNAKIPYGCTIENIYLAMTEWVNFLGFINLQLNTKSLQRFETMLMPANFSSMVGEFMGATIPKHCKTLVKNEYHNGHPDMLPANKYPLNAVQHLQSRNRIEGVSLSQSVAGPQCGRLLADGLCV